MSEQGSAKRGVQKFCLRGSEDIMKHPECLGRVVEFHSGGGENPFKNFKVEGGGKKSVITLHD